MRENLVIKVSEIADAPASFKSDLWKPFGFLVSGNEKERRRGQSENDKVPTLPDQN